MEETGLFEHLAKIISEAAKSTLGIIALIICAISILVFLLFKKEDSKTKLIALWSLIIGCGIFLFAAIKTNVPTEVKINNDVSSKVNVDETVDTFKLYNLVWTKNNLKIKSGNSCRSQDTVQQKVYGEYYTQDEAKAACVKLESPGTWRLPDLQEFRSLIRRYGKGDKEKAHDRIVKGNSGINVKLGGYCEDGKIKDFENVGYYWTKDSDDSKNLGRAFLFNDRDQAKIIIDTLVYDPKLRISCLCVRGILDIPNE